MTGAKTKLFNISDQKGAALLMVVTVTAILMAVVIEFSYSSRVDLSLALNFQNDAKSGFLARGGIDAAAVLLIYDYQQDDKQLDYYYGDMSMEEMPDELWSLAYTMPIEMGDGTVIVNIEDELGKVNINQFVNKSGVRAKDEVIQDFARWIERFDIDPDIADRIGYSVVDWVDLDDNTGDFGGKESDFYNNLQIDGIYSVLTAYKARNAPFCSPDELQLIDGVTDEIYNKLSEFVTIFPERSPNGLYPINVNTAKQEVFYFLDEEIDETIAAALIETRLEKPFENVTDFKNALVDNGITAEKANVISSKVVFRSDYFRVRAEAIVDNVSKIITAVLKRNGKKNDVEIIYWQVL